jgi:uncharacterized damage-inducible protein DinB
MTALLDDAFAHHIWATERLIDACTSLTLEQLAISTPGTYGPIMATLTHLVASDGWYLSYFREQPAPIDEASSVTLADLRAAIAANDAVWRDISSSGATDGSSTSRPACAWRRRSITARITGARSAPP